MNSRHTPISEKFLQSIVVTNFQQRGYNVINQCIDDPNQFEDITECTTHEIFGIDVVAQREKELWIIEVKGQPKGVVSSCTTIFMAGIGQILTRISRVSEEIHYALAIPNTDCYAPSARKFINSPILSLLNLSIILIQEDEKIEFIK